MQAATINCPMCGAAASTDASECGFCGARLATVACPQCFAMMFAGTKFCPHCGAQFARHDLSNTSRKCPRCKQELARVSIGNSEVLECESCSGLWLDAPTFEKICADRERQAAVLGAASLATGGNAVEPEKVSYIPCPECAQLMNRANFARCSGVIIDICKKHGVWFDRDELSRIIEFINSGGLDESRSREKASLEEERRRIHDEQASLARSQSSIFDPYDPAEHRANGIASAGGLLRLLLG